MENQVLKTKIAIKLCYYVKNALYYTTVKNAFDKLLVGNQMSHKNVQYNNWKTYFNSNLKIYQT